MAHARLLRLKTRERVQLSLNIYLRSSGRTTWYRRARPPNFPLPRASIDSNSKRYRRWTRCWRWSWPAVSMLASGRMSSRLDPQCQL